MFALLLLGCVEVASVRDTSGGVDVDVASDDGPSLLVTVEQGAGRDIDIFLSGPLSGPTPIEVAWSMTDVVAAEAIFEDGASRVLATLPDPCVSFEVGARSFVLRSPDGAWAIAAEVELAGRTEWVSPATAAVVFDLEGAPVAFCGDSPLNQVEIVIEGGYRFDRASGEAGFVLRSGEASANMGGEMSVPAGVLEIEALDSPTGPYALVVDRL